MVDVVYGEGYAKVVAGIENVPKEGEVIDSSAESRERKLVAFLSYLLHAQMKFDSVLQSRQSVKQYHVETLSWNWKDYLRNTSQELILQVDVNRELNKNVLADNKKNTDEWFVELKIKRRNPDHEARYW